MSKHTPGPWKITRGNRVQELPVLGAEGQEIACVRYKGRLADARLIAAAPLLLEAARTAGYWLHNEICKGRCHADCLSVQAAIEAAGDNE